MDQDFQNKTDDELIEIIRRAENTNVSGSSYQKAQIEFDLRHKIKMTKSTNAVSEVVAKSGKKYYIKREIGRGGFGVVYLVGSEDGTNYALKFLAPASDEDVKAQFLAETESVMGIENQNIIKVFDYGEGKINSLDGVFVVSEYCDGGNYKSHLKGSPVNAAGIEAAISDIKQLLSGLAVLNKKIVHRDIKPENILVKAGVLKLGDFGLSKLVDQATRTLTFKGSGTPRYMAPEVWSYQHATPAADLYSLGVLFFEMLTGVAPFESNDIHELRSMHLTKAAPRAKTINSAIPDKLDGVVKKLLFKEPAKRYQSAEEVLEVLGSSMVETNPEMANILSKARKFQDSQEVQKSEFDTAEQKRHEELSKNQYKQTEVTDLVEDVINTFNTEMPEARIVKTNANDYRFGGRNLVIQFFAPGELYRNPEVPGRMKALTDNHVIHGGYIEVKENGEDRQGWNLYLTRKPDEMYGEWFIVETDVSALVGQALRYPPTMATNAKLFADNLACHIGHIMHVYNLKSKPLERADIVKILEFFIP